MIIEGRIDIARSPDDVFDYLADMGNWKAIDKALLKVSPDGAVGLGSSGTMTHKRPGVKVKTSWEVTAFERAGRFEILVTGFGYALRETVTLTEIPSGARVDITDLTLPTSIVGRVMVAVSGRTIRRELEVRNQRLKTLLETDARSAG